MAKVADKTKLVELTEREFDLRLRMEQLSLSNDAESAEELVRLGGLYAKVKDELGKARKAELETA